MLFALLEFAMEPLHLSSSFIRSILHSPQLYG